jgi:DNA-binding CsgD family transcriptional regulator
VKLSEYSAHGPKAALRERAAGAVVRYQQLQRECDVLRRLVSGDQRALLLFDEAQQLQWASPAARLLLARDERDPALLRAAAAAGRELVRASTAPGAAPGPGRPRRFVAPDGSPLLVEFSALHTADGVPWLLAELRRQPAARSARLTRAESRVLDLLAEGLSNREIAGELLVSTETVRTHVSRILQKLGVDSRGKAARLARDARSP